MQRLARLEHGRLSLRDAQGEYQFGDRRYRGELCATITVRDPQFYADVALGGNVGAGEAYIHGTWDCDDPTALVRIMIRNKQVLYGFERGTAWVSKPFIKFAHWLNRNSLKGSRRNIAAHYDLGNELFELFLDETMMYSSAIFSSPESTLYEASLTKNDLICRKLDLGPDDHLLEIGTGWGGFALHAASRYGCKVTSTTISRQQYELASQRVKQAGLEDKITLLLQDYRELQGSFDKLVSIEMIEAVGHQFFDTYFKKCNDLLKPDGLMLIQSITINDQQFPVARNTVDFIKRFIFPGGCLPSVSVLSQCVASVTDMRVIDLQDIGPHYARTLREWRTRFVSRLAEINRLGYPESFQRMWIYYLCYCEGGFIERNIGALQLLLAKPLARRAPLDTRI